jgi:hypothetical protein
MKILPKFLIDFIVELRIPTLNDMTSENEKITKNIIVYVQETLHVFVGK